MYLLESQYQETLAFIHKHHISIQTRENEKASRLHIFSSEAAKRYLVSRLCHFRLLENFHLHYIYNSAFPGQNGAVNLSVQLERFNESEAVTKSW